MSLAGRSVGEPAVYDWVVVGRSMMARMIGPWDIAVNIPCMCDNRDVQNLLWPADMNKKLVYARPMAYLRIFFKDMRHVLQTAR
ncbi:hypothetical protein [Novosphingobium sp. Chol11]|uniref:hypothetical protein n=1 Tax=Novosphingobium sp. Chol11 TaxID=1385763 RepID=UPI0025EAE839|nr:hypothetical protein [Novosphingobium sp. Chol11]